MWLSDLKLWNIYLSIPQIFLLQGKNPNDFSIKYFEGVPNIDYSLNNENENNCYMKMKNIILF